MSSRRRRETIVLVGAAVLAIAVPTGLAHHLDQRIEQGLEPALADALGVGVEIGSIEANLTGTLRIEGLAIGRLLTADAVEASVALSSLLGGDIRADELRLEHPHLRIYVDRDGRANLERILRRATTARARRHADGQASAASARHLPRIIVTDGDLVVAIGDGGELHLGGVELHPQSGGVRLVAGKTTIAHRDQRWSVVGHFARTAADVSLPQLTIGRALAAGGELLITPASGAVTHVDNIVVTRGMDGQSRLEVTARAQRNGHDSPVHLIASALGDSIRVSVEGTDIPLAALAPLLPGAVELAGASASGTATVEFAGTTIIGLAVDAELSDVTLDHRHLAPVPFSLSGQLRLLAAALPASPGQQRSIEVSELAFTTGELVVEASGQASFAPGHYLPEHGTLKVAVPPVGCSAALAALPAPMTNRLAGLHAKGTTSASLRLRFDRRSVDDTHLDVDVDVAGCRVTSEAISADPSILTQPFGHIYPDGSTGIVGSEATDYASLRSLPAHVAGAFVAAEDARFFRHAGFDPRQIERSLAINLVDGRFARGGSTISQQLVKNIFLSPDRSLTRKFQEAVITWRLERKLDKRLILERYLNIIELDSGVFGIGAAAKHWFGKPAQKLSVAETAFLAALTPAPRSFGRRIRAAGGLDAVTARRVAVVLRHMRRGGVIGEASYRRALDTRLQLRVPVVASR